MTNVLNFFHKFQTRNQTFLQETWLLLVLIRYFKGFPGGAVVKNIPAIQEIQETQVWPMTWENPLEEEMASHSSIPAWEIPWTKGPGVLEPMGQQSLALLGNWACRHAMVFQGYKLSTKGVHCFWVSYCL